MIGDRIKLLRQKAGLSQESLAQKAGLKSATIAQLEQHRNKDPRWSTVLKLADALEVSIHAFRDPRGD